MRDFLKHFLTSVDTCIPFLAKLDQIQSPNFLDVLGTVAMQDI
jgi:hypothetical protein